MRQNLCDLLKFIFTINVLFRLLSKLKLHPTIKFTSNCSFKSFSFLNVKVSFNDGTDDWSCSLYFILTLQTNISTFYAHHVTQEGGWGIVTFGKMQFSPSQLSNFLFMHLLLSVYAPYTLAELFHSALSWEYDVYVPPTRHSNCVVTNSQNILTKNTIPWQTWIQSRSP